MKEIVIGHRTIGLNHPPYIVAEISGNHNQSLERALEIVVSAKKAGAHAVKLQTYTADTLTLDCESDDFIINDPKSLWRGKSLHALYQEAYTPWEWHEPIFKKCRELGIDCFSTPFDDSAVDLLEDLNAPCYKIASFENNHLPLIERVAKTGKPVIVSTGTATLDELKDVVDTMKKAGNDQLMFLKCTSAYPAEPSDANLNSIPFLRDKFAVQIGLSDHTLGLAVPLAAIALGVRFIEKHFTLDRNDGGVDSAFSLTPAELESLVIESQRAWEALGNKEFGLSSADSKGRQYKRSIYVSQDIPEGAAFTEQNVRIVRPGHGLPPKNLDKVLSSRAALPLKKGHALKASDLAGN